MEGLSAEGALRLSGIGGSRERRAGSEVCPPAPRFINNPAKLVDLEGQWEAALPVYIPSPGYNP